MSFVFDVELEAQKVGISSANPANPANSEPRSAPEKREISKISGISSTGSPNLAELRALIHAIADHWQFTPEERQEALRAALNDPENAFSCYRDIASKARLWPKPAPSKVH